MTGPGWMPSAAMKSSVLSADAHLRSRKPTCDPGSPYAIQEAHLRSSQVHPELRFVNRTTEPIDPQTLPSVCPVYRGAHGFERRGYREVPSSAVYHATLSALSPAKGIICRVPDSEPPARQRNSPICRPTQLTPLPELCLLPRAGALARTSGARNPTIASLSQAELRETLPSAP